MFSQSQFSTLETLFLQVADQPPSQLPSVLPVRPTPWDRLQDAWHVWAWTAAAIFSIPDALLVPSHSPPPSLPWSPRSPDTGSLMMCGHCFSKTMPPDKMWWHTHQKQYFLVKKSIECFMSQLCKTLLEVKWAAVGGWGARTKTVVSEGHGVRGYTLQSTGVPLFVRFA